MADDDLGSSGPVELVPLSVKDRAVRCRFLADGRSVTVRARRFWEMVPGEIVTKK